MAPNPKTQIPNPQSPIPNPQSPNKIMFEKKILKKLKLKIFICFILLNKLK
jgi:hypothetical protein